MINNPSDSVPVPFETAMERLTFKAIVKILENVQKAADASPTLITLSTGHELVSRDHITRIIQEHIKEASKYA